MADVMNAIKDRLVLSFKLSTDKTVSLSVDDPRVDLTELEIKSVMDSIITNAIFEIEGADMVSKVSAKIVSTDTTSYDLEV